MRKTLFLIAAIAVGLLSVAGYRSLLGRATHLDQFVTEPIKRGDLLATFSATGTVEPEDVVDVGAQVAGQIKEFGPEPGTGKTIDYHSHVEPGTVLARIDDSLYKARVDQSRA